MSEATPRPDEGVEYSDRPPGLLPLGQLLAAARGRETGVPLTMALGGYVSAPPMPRPSAVRPALTRVEGVKPDPREVAAFGHWWAAGRVWSMWDQWCARQLGVEARGHA